MAINTKKHFNKHLKHPIDSIFEDGYGQVSKRVMQDSRLSIEAKSIYSYLCSFAGGGNTAYPAVVKICRDLKISKDRYYRHVADIVEVGYIVVNKNFDSGGKFPNNEYVFNYTVPRQRKKDSIEIFKNGGWTTSSLIALKAGDKYRMWDKEGKLITDKTTGLTEFTAEEDFAESVNKAYKGKRGNVG